MKTHSIRNSGYKDFAVCPYATGFHKQVQCKLINCLPVDVVFRLCGSHFNDCDEFRVLRKQEQNVSAHKRRKIKIRRMPDRPEIS